MNTEKNLANNLYIIFFYWSFLLWSGLLISTHLFFKMNNFLLTLFGDSSLKLPVDNTYGIISKILLDKVIVNWLSHFSLSHIFLVHSTNSLALRSSTVLNPSRFFLWYSLLRVHSNITHVNILLISLTLSNSHSLLIIKTFLFNSCNI